MNKTYLFYDIESTGLNPCFDQVLQFAAIRTDMELNEIDRTEIRIKLNPDIIPAPMAMLTHLQSIEQMQTGLSEVEGIQKIHALINTPGTISLGYNTLGFDDEFLRFSFYRNLLTPYTHQYANQCSRMDIYPMLLLYYLFKPEIIQWPKINEKISLKLEHINKANQLASGMAHDAMIDVEVTVALAKKCFKEQAMWQYCCGYFDKKTDSERLHQLKHTVSINHQAYPLAYACYGKLGAKNNFMTPVLGLGGHATYKNQTLWLRLDQADLLQCQPDTLFKHSFVIKRKPADNIFILPYHERYHHLVDEQRQDHCQQSLAWCEQQADLFQQLQLAHQQFTYPMIDNIDADAALYQLPFASGTQTQRMRQFHQEPAENKMRLAEQLGSDTLLELALRLVAKHYPESLNQQQADAFQQHLQQIYQPTAAIVDYKNQGKAQAHTVLAEIKALKQQDHCSPQHQQLLAGLENYINTQHQIHLNPIK